MAVAWSLYGAPRAVSGAPGVVSPWPEPVCLSHSAASVSADAVLPADTGSPGLVEHQGPYGRAGVTGRIGRARGGDGRTRD